jgi:hypothetical protein
MREQTGLKVLSLAPATVSCFVYGQSLQKIVLFRKLNASIMVDVAALVRVRRPPLLQLRSIRQGTCHPKHQVKRKRSIRVSARTVLVNGSSQVMNTSSPVLRRRRRPHTTARNFLCCHNHQSQPQHIGQGHDLNIP